MVLMFLLPLRIEAGVRALYRRQLDEGIGQTADYAEEEGEDTSDVQIVLGFRAWF